MRWICVLSVFFSALLAFSVEPLTAKRLLPAFGGSAAVWVTCLVTFQGLLLLGYLYADLLLRAPRRWQLPLHGAVLALPFLVMPFGTPVAPPSDAAPAPWLVLELLRGAALPFFALSTNATLVQHWYAKREGKAPWFLYAASNAGSLAGLLGYPLIVEPRLGLASQSVRWMAGYVAFALVTGAIAWIAARDSSTGPATSPPPPRSQVVRWVVRSAIGAWLLTSVSFWVTLDVAGLPLLWVVPLAIYLLTFVLAFSVRVPFPRRYLAIFAMLFVMLGVESFIAGAVAHTWLVLLSAFGALFLGAWVVHGDLARDRPAEDRLSAYYLWIALGGFLGGVAGNVIAPQLFDTVAEYPLALAVLAFALAIEKDTSAVRATLQRPATWAIAAAMVLVLAGTAMAFRSMKEPWLTELPVAVLAMGVLAFRRLPGLFGVGVTLTALFAALGWLRGPSLDTERSFYGTLRVSEEAGVRVMAHGTTIHGVERLGGIAPPGSYYHPQTSLGSVMVSFAEGSRIGVIGLGAGALAALSKSGQQVDFFEIDPMVETMARRWFTFLERSPAPVTVTIGDARLTLEKAPDGAYDGLFVDAFSSDAIPVHLLTTEATALYLRKLKPGGVVVFHVSNRFFDLRRVVKGSALALGVPVVWMPWEPTDELLEKELAMDTWAVMVASSAGELAPHRARGWREVEAEPITWTDDHSSLVPLLQLGKPEAEETEAPVVTGTASTAALSGP